MGRCWSVRPVQRPGLRWWGLSHLHGLEGQPYRLCCPGSPHRLGDHLLSLLPRLNTKINLPSAHPPSLSCLTKTSKHCVPDVIRGTGTVQSSPALSYILLTN